MGEIEKKTVINRKGSVCGTGEGGTSKKWKEFNRYARSRGAYERLNN